jgi:hypothetical protein
MGNPVGLGTEEDGDGSSMHAVVASCKIRKLINEYYEMYNAILSLLSR